MGIILRAVYNNRSVEDECQNKGKEIQYQYILNQGNNAPDQAFVSHRNENLL